MQKKISRFCDYLSTVLRFFPFLCLMFYVLRQNGPKLVSLPRLFLLLLYPCLLLFLRNSVKKMLPFSILSLLAGGVFVFFSSTRFPEYWICGVFCAGAFLRSAWRKWKRKPDGVPLAYPVLSFSLIGGCCLLFSFFHDVYGQSVCFRMFLLFLFLYLPEYYLEQYGDFLAQSRYAATEMPQRRILSTGLFQLSIFLLITFFVTLLLSGFPPDGIAGFFLMLGRGFVSSIIWILEWIGGFFGAPEDGALAPPPEAAGGNGAYSWLELLLISLLTAIVIFGALYLLYQLFKWLFDKKDLVIDKKESLLFREARQPAEKNEKRKADLKNSSLHWIARDNNEKIRKLFFHVVTKLTASPETRLPAGLAPAEYAAGYPDPERQEQMRLLASFYEKARYAPGMCTKEEVTRAKECARRLS